MSQAWSFQVDGEGIGRLVLDLPGKKVNVLSLLTLQELEGYLDKIKENKDVKALVISSAKQDSFIAGADLSSFEELSGDKAKVENLVRNGHRIFKKIEDLPIPTIAVINGTCLGGGMELALACHYRIASDHPKTMLGLPEVTLGLVPGWGGSQRMPRLVGYSEGLNLILTGKPIPAMKAWRIKLIDAVVRHEFLGPKAEEFVRACLDKDQRKKIRNKRMKTGVKHWLMEGNPVGRMIVKEAAKRKVLSKTKGQYPAPAAALDIISSTYTKPLNAGLETEAKMFLSSWSKLSDVSKHLLQLFFTSEALKKDPGIALEAAPRAVRRTGVIGAGIMGAGIAQLFSKMNYPVRMKDKTWELVGKGYGTAWNEYKALTRKKLMGHEEALLKWQKISGCIDYSGFTHTDFIVEAIVENLEIKQSVMKELEQNVPKEAIICTNTSSLTVEDIGRFMQHPERLIGFHFFNPVSRLPLVEVVPGSHTSKETLSTAIDFCRKLGKVPIVMRDKPGFLVNRVFVAGANEMLRMLEEGVPMADLAKAFVDFGLPKDPFAVFDDVGNDINMLVMKNLEKAYGERMKMPDIIAAMNAENLLGKKTGQGFYLYENNKAHPNPKLKKLLTEKKSSSILSKAEIQKRALFLMIDEAARCLEEQVVASPGYLDLALVMGVGFPAFRGGLLFYADEAGIPNVVTGLQNFEKQYGKRFTTCQKLLDMVRFKQKFYG